MKLREQAEKDLKKVYSFNKCNPLSPAVGVLIGVGGFLFAALVGNVILNFTINFISVIAGKYATEHFSEMITRPIFGIAGLAVVILGLMLIKYLNREVKEEISEESDEEKKSA